jgi:hypothetical protein
MWQGKAGSGPCHIHKQHTSARQLDITTQPQPANGPLRDLTASLHRKGYTPSGPRVSVTPPKFQGSSALTSSQQAPGSLTLWPTLRLTILRLTGCVAC